MIDPITERMLHENAMLRSFKVIGQQFESALRRGNMSAIEKISNKLPKENLNQIKMRSSKKFPKFRQKYDEAKRIIRNSKILEPEIHEPAVVAIAIVSSATNMKVSDVLSRGEAGLVQGKILSLLIPGFGLIGPIVKLAFFIIILIGVLSAAGVGISAAFSALSKAASFLFAILGNAGSAISKIAKYISPEGVEKVASAAGETHSNMSTIQSLASAFNHANKALDLQVDPGVNPGGVAGMFFKVKK